MASRTVAWIVAAISVMGCARSAPVTDTITLATTTSTRDSGLLDVLLPEFEARHSVRVKVVAVGSGQALELGRRGDADVLLTHAPAAEQKFMDEGWGLLRRPVMYNDFVLLGPAADPAGVANESSVPTAFQRISETGSPFVSRDDQSGTHQQELAIWAEARLRPDGEWYLRSGAGMAATLRVASERQGYTLADRATFLAHRDQLDLAILLEGDARLRNSYAVLVVHPARHPHLATDRAREFTQFLLAAETQHRIAQFGVERYGEPLFFVEQRVSR